MNVTLTLFQSLTNPVGRRIETTWKEFCGKLSQPRSIGLVYDSDEGREVPDKQALEGWSAATFEGNKRAKKTVETISALVLDADGGVPLAQAETHWGEFRGFLYTSPQHQFVPGEDRFRVILFLSRQVTDTEYARLWSWVNERAKTAGFVLDPAPKDVSRFWYMPGILKGAPFETREFHGTVIDVDAVLAQTPKVTSRQSKRAEARREAKESLRERKQTAQHVAQTHGIGERHEAMKSLVGSLRARGYGYEELLTALQEYNDAHCNPPSPEPELVGLAQWGASLPAGYNLTDLGNAERLMNRHGADLRWCFALGWLVWDGQRWARDQTLEVERRAQDTIRSLYAEAATLEDDYLRAALVEHAKESESNGRLIAMVKIARALPGVAVRVEALDADPWVFNCVSGTLDLRTGTLGPHRREDLITKISAVPYDPNATCPLYDKFLERVQPDPEVRDFIDRLDGYSLTGVIREHVLPTHYGHGRNGKGVRTNTKLRILGDYGKQIPTELLMAKDRDDHPTERATLLGCRFAAAVETEEGRKLNVALVKQLTGGDPIAARYMRQDFFEFWPSHKIEISTNHKPIIRETKDAIWERVLLILWGVKIPMAERDTSLEEKLRAEHPGILARFVRGCLEWQRVGLVPPKAVQVATQEFRHEMDRIQEFIEEQCAVELQAKAWASDLYKAYQSWCERRGMRYPSQTTFGESLSEKEFCSTKTHGVIRYSGIRLLSPEECAARDTAARGDSRDRGDPSAGSSSHARAWSGNPETHPQYPHSPPDSSSNGRASSIEYEEGDAA